MDVDYQLFCDILATFTYAGNMNVDIFREKIVWEKIN